MEPHAYGKEGMVDTVRPIRTALLTIENERVDRLLIVRSAQGAVYLPGH